MRFNGKIYEDNRPVKNENGNGLGRLCFDIFKYYLELNMNKEYNEIKLIFNKLHKSFSGKNSKKQVVFNEQDFWNWYNNYSNKDSKKDKRYFGYGDYGKPIQYNQDKYYFTTQWGNSDGNIDNMINFAKQQGYDIEIIESDKKGQEIIINIPDEFLQNITIP